VISTTDDESESESESISIGVCLEYPCSLWGAADGGDARGPGLRGFGRKLEVESTTLAGGAIVDVLADVSSTSSPLDVVSHSELNTSGDVLVLGGDD